MKGSATIGRLDRAFFVRLADWLVFGVAIALPWSTSGTGICIAAWLVVLLPTFDWAALRRELTTPAGGLPVVLWCLGVLGMFWADVGWQERLAGLDSFHRVLAVPMLLAQFRTSWCATLAGRRSALLLRGGAGTQISRQAAQQRRGAADRGKYRQAASEPLRKPWPLALGVGGYHR
jgi:hypothetical protein